MTVRVYKSTDASAPVLNGTAGSLVALLDAVLVNGYGATAGSGWTKAFTGVNLAAYRMGIGTNLHYLRVDDTAATGGNILAYESMTAISTGTAPFPTATQSATGLYIVKSSLADATARAWVAVTTDRTLYLHINLDSDANSLNSNLTIFGQFTSNKTGDTYNTCLIANSTALYTSGESSQLAALASPLAGHYIARSYTQLGASVATGKGSDSYKAENATYIGSGGLVYPSPVDGGLYLAPVWLTEAAIKALRGTLTGLWNPLHLKPLAHLDTFSGTGSLAGKTFLALNVYNNAQVFLETSNTW